MSHVSCRITQSVLAFLERNGHDPRTFVSTLNARHGDEFSVDFEKLSDKNAHVPWRSFAHFTNALDGPLGAQGDWRDRYMSELFEDISVIVPHIGAVLRLVSSPLQLIMVLTKLLGPSNFGDTVRVHAEKLGADCFLLRLTLPPEVPDCPNFFRITEVTTRYLPRFIGMPDAIVDFELRDREAFYTITLPRAPSFASRARRWLAAVFSAPALNAMTEQDRALRTNYERLLKSDAELRETRTELESRVNERTRELARANELLRSQLEGIVRKEDENRQLNDRLVHLQKLDAIGTLAGGISHEINNVLHGIYLSLDLADRRIDEDHPAKDRVSTAKKFAIRGKDLMNQVLAFSRKAQLERRPVAVKETIAEAVKLMRTTLPRKINISENFDEVANDACVFGDATQIQQIVINLCANAAYAMRARGGCLTLSLENVSGGVLLRVRDVGEGIAPDVQARIFEPFFTTKPVGEGTGMGLAVVHGIVESHGGSIDVVSGPHSGAEFRVRLPIAEECGDDAEAALAVESIGGPERLLIVDDESELVSLLADTLGLFGYDVQVATSAERALELFARDPSSYDLLLTDYSMPGMDGAELLRRVRQLRPEMPVLICTGLDHIKALGDARDLASACVTKPFDAYSLNEAIRAVIARSQAHA